MESLFETLAQMTRPNYSAKEPDEDFTPYGEIREKPILCNLCGEEINPEDYDAIEYSGILYGYPHTEKACGVCLEDPEFQDCLSKVKNLKKSFINR